MTTEIAVRPDEIDSTNRNQRNGSATPAGQAGGSPPRGDGTDGSGSEGSTSSSDGGGNGAGPDPAAETKELRRKLSEQADAIAKLSQVAYALNEHEDLKEELLRRAGGGSGDTEFSELDAEIDDNFNEKSAAAMKKLLRKATDIAERRAEAKVKPLYGEVRRSAASADFVRAIRHNGLDAEVLEDPDFQDHLKEMRGSHRSFSSLERDDPATAAYLAAASWKDRTGRRTDYAAERRRVEDARESSLNARGSAPSKSAAAQTVDVPQSAGMRGVLDAIKRGAKPDQIRRIRNT